MSMFYRLPFFGFDAASGFGRKEISSDVLNVEVTCAGTNLAGAAEILPAFYSAALDIKNIVVFAKYVNASNRAVKIPSLNPDYQFTIFASASAFPSASAVDVFLPAGATFVDGTTSLSIPAGVGKTLRVVGLNSGNQVWGSI